LEHAAVTLRQQLLDGQSAWTTEKQQSMDQHSQSITLQLHACALKHEQELQEWKARVQSMQDDLVRCHSDDQSRTDREQGLRVTVQQLEQSRVSLEAHIKELTTSFEIKSNDMTVAHEATLTQLRAQNVEFDRDIQHSQSELLAVRSQLQLVQATLVTTQTELSDSRVQCQMRSIACLCVYGMHDTRVFSCAHS
jgi:hypothetical protein